MCFQDDSSAFRLLMRNQMESTSKVPVILPQNYNKDNQMFTNQQFAGFPKKK